jgi:hypothetical protein
LSATAGAGRLSTGDTGPIRAALPSWSDWLTRPLSAGVARAGEELDRALRQRDKRELAHREDPNLVTNLDQVEHTARFGPRRRNQRHNRGHVPSIPATPNEHTDHAAVNERGFGQINHDPRTIDHHIIQDTLEKRQGRKPIDLRGFRVDSPGGRVGFVAGVRYVGGDILAS